MDNTESAESSHAAGNKIVNQFMGQKAGMADVDKQTIFQKIQEMTAGTNKAAFQKNLEQKRNKQIDELKLRIQDYRRRPEQMQRVKSIVQKMVEKAESARDLSRVWAHFDFDMFYIACELLQRPDLKDKPCAVGSEDGVLCTSNYVARRFGVRAALPTFIAKKLCPQLVLIHPNMEKYRRFSDIFREILSQYDPDLESHGMDEAYVDLTAHIEGKTDQEVEQFVRAVRTRIYERTGLTVSCGLGANYMLCKMASEEKKPNDQFILKNDKDQIIRYIQNKPIRKIPGIGPVQELYLKGIGVNTPEQLLQKVDEVRVCFSQNATEALISDCLGISRNYHVWQDQKSLSRSQTFRATDDQLIWLEKLGELCSKLAADLRDQGVVSNHLTLSYQTEQFRKQDKSIKLNTYTWQQKDIFGSAKKNLLIDNRPAGKIRLLAIRCTNLLKQEDFCKQSLQNFFNKKTSHKPKWLADLEGAPGGSVHADVEDQQKLEKKVNESSQITMDVQRSIAQKNLDAQSKSTCLKLQCPVCLNLIDCKGNNAAFNKHVDRCLISKMEQTKSNDSAQKDMTSGRDSSPIALKRAMGRPRKNIVTANGSKVNSEKKPTQIKSFNKSKSQHGGGLGKFFHKKDKK